MPTESPATAAPAADLLLRTSGPTDLGPAPLLLDAAQVCKMLRIGLTTLHALRRTGRFGPTPIRLGRAVRFRADEIAAWCAASCPTRMVWEARRTAGRKGER